MVEHTMEPELTISEPIETAASRARRFPWWLAALIAAILSVYVLIFVNPSYSETFAFVREGLLVTISVSLSAYGIALVIGLFAGLGRISRNVVFNNIATFYVETIRGVPMLVLIFYLALVGVPMIVEWAKGMGTSLLDLGIGVGAWLEQLDIQQIPMATRAIVALAVTYGAFLAEIFRAGIQSIEPGQMEAARSLGMSYGQAMRYVILPQAIRNVLPALGNDFIAMLKDSSLVSVLAVRDITQLSRLYAGRSFRFREAYTILLVMYLSMTIVLSMAVRYLERRMRSDR
ncbi:MAG: amino acid ABC transporter permease [Anaerolineae bacterium]